MIKRLQRKFVVIAAVCLLIVEFTIIGGINGVNIYQTNKNADDLLNIIIENDGRFPEFDPKGMKHDKPQDNSDSASPPESKKPDKHRGFNEETKYQTRYFVVYADSNGEITKVDTGHVAAVSSSQAIEYGKSVLDSGKTSGTSGNYRYKTGDTDKGKMVAVTNSQYDLMAAVMAGGMIPPLGLALACLLFPTRFTKAERRTVPQNLVMGASFVTEGALPFALRDPLRVVPSCMAGSALAGFLTVLFGCGCPAPHGGLFLLAVIGNPLGFLAALAAGSLLTTLLVGMLKKPVKS